MRVAVGSETVYRQLLLVILFGLLAFGSASGQESGSFTDSIAPNNAAQSDDRSASSFHLKGVLISRSQRTALVNGQLLQVGDRLGGFEILAVDQAGVRVLMGAEELTVDVGGTVVGNRSSSDVIRVSNKRTPASRNPMQRTVVLPAPPQDRSVSSLNTHLQHAVKSGETLSGIALHYLRGGVTMNQMMIALFQANMQAFDDNINVLYEGATLRIPNEIELHHHTPETATAEVMHHTNRWQVAYQQRTSVADRSNDAQYGPVESGETLSGIAASVLHDGVTMNQMMIALYQSNPHAFRNNINVLRQGATLRMPDENDLRRESPETATAEVARHTKAWQTGFEQHALVTSAHANIMASSDEPAN